MWSIGPQADNQFGLEGAEAWILIAWCIASWLSALDLSFETSFGSASDQLRRPWLSATLENWTVPTVKSEHSTIGE